MFFVFFLDVTYILALFNGGLLLRVKQGICINEPSKKWKENEMKEENTKINALAILAYLKCNLLFVTLHIVTFMYWLVIYPHPHSLPFTHLIQALFLFLFLFLFFSNAFTVYSIKFLETMKTLPFHLAASHILSMILWALSLFYSEAAIVSVPISRGKGLVKKNVQIPWRVTMLTPERDDEVLLLLPLPFYFAKCLLL